MGTDHEDQNRMQLGAGTTLQKGKYLLNHVLDQQGIGWTYRATHTQLNQSVIVKTLNPVFRSHPEYRRICEEFEARSQQWARSRHPGLVRVLDFFYEGTMPQALPFVVMESVSGVNLSDRLRKETLSEADIISLLRQIASALTYAQDQGLVHGNVRPRNIMRRSGTQSEPQSGSQNYVLVGSAASLMPSLFERSALQNPYAAPELSHGKITSSADLYSLGAILYTCLSGHSPTLAVPDAPLTDRLPLLSLLKPGARRLLRSAMTHVSRDRPATPDAWLALLASRSTAPVAPSPVTPVRLSPQPVATPEALPRYRTDPLPEESAPIKAIPIPLPAFQTRPHPTPPPTVQTQPPQLVLPDRSLPIPPARPAQHSTFNIQHSTFKTLLPPARSLKLTAAIAITSGILFGLILRFQAAQRPGSSLFHTGQSFPVREWKGTIEPPNDNLDGIPIEAPGSSPSRSRSGDVNSAAEPNVTVNNTTVDRSPSPTPGNSAIERSVAPSAPRPNRRPATPLEPPIDPVPNKSPSNPPLDPSPRSVAPDLPLQSDPAPVTAPDSTTAPRSTAPHKL